MPHWFKLHLHCFLVFYPIINVEVELKYLLDFSFRASSKKVDLIIIRHSGHWLHWKFKSMLQFYPSILIGYKHFYLVSFDSVALVPSNYKYVLSYWDSCCRLLSVLHRCNRFLHSRICYPFIRLERESFALIHDCHVVIAEFPASDCIKVASLNNSCEGVSWSDHWVDWFDVIIK